MTATTKKTKYDKREPWELNWAAYQRNTAATGHDDWLRESKRQERALHGDQWDPAVKAEVEADGRPALTINVILSTMNIVAGQQRANRADIRFKPRSGGATDEVALTLNKLYQAISQANMLDFVESEMFMDGMVQDRGYIQATMKYEDNFQGEVHYNTVDPREIILDANASEYDPSTWSEIIRTRWVSLDQIAVAYGQKKVDELKRQGASLNHFGTDSIRYEQEDVNTFGGHANDVNEYGGDVSDPHNTQIKSIRLIEREYYERRPVQFFVDPESGEKRQVPSHWKEERIRNFIKKMGLYSVVEDQRVVRWTVTADKVTLHDEDSPYRTFSIIPYFPYFRRGRPSGLVRHLLDPQDQYNKLASQELHIVNTTTNSGWIMDEDALVGMSPDELENHGAKTGLVLVKRKGREVEKIKPNPIPTGIDRLAERSSFQVREISGVNEAIRGEGTTEVSGVALQSRQNAAQVQLQVPFDNLTRTRHLLAKKFLELVQDFYSEQRVIRLTREDRRELPQEEIRVNEVTPEGAIVNDITVGKYDVIASTAPSRDSYNDVQFAEAIGMVQAGIPIPFDRVVEYSNLAERMALAEEMRQLEGRGELTEEQQRMQKMLQDLETRGIFAEVREKEARVAQLEAQAVKLEAESMMKAGGMDSPEVQSQLEKIRADIQMHREELQVRLQVAQTSALNKLDIADVGARAKVISTVRQGQAQLAAEEIKAKNKPKPAASGPK